MSPTQEPTRDAQHPFRQDGMRRPVEDPSPPVADERETALSPVEDAPLEIPVEVIREEVLDAQQHPEQAEAQSKPSEPYIAFQHVSKAFGDLVVLDDVSFQVMTG